MKGIWRSKTFWLNIIAIITQVLEVLPLDPSITTAVPEVPIGLLAAANIGARWITQDPVTVVPSKADKV